VYALESRPVHPSQSAPLPRTIWEAARVRRAVHTIVSQPCSLLISPSDIGRRVRGAATAVGGSVNFASKKNSDSSLIGAATPACMRTEHTRAWRRRTKCIRLKSQYKNTTAVVLSCPRVGCSALE
jgi:hypothetical protein